MFVPIEVRESKSVKLRILFIGEEDTKIFSINYEADWQPVRNTFSTLEMINMVSTESFFENCQREEFKPNSVNLVYDIVSDSSYESRLVPIVSRSIEGSISESDALDEIVDIAWMLTDNALRNELFGRVWDYHKYAVRNEKMADDDSDLSSSCAAADDIEADSDENIPRTFSIGQIVRLKSGGQAMTVSKVEPMPDHFYKITCTWFNDENLIVNSFHEMLLVDARPLSRTECYRY